MGLRNPFRIEYNQETGELYIADYSPDASTAEPAARAGRPGQVVGRHRGGATSAGRTARPPSCPTSTTTSPRAVSGAAFNCANPVNESPNNTGLTNLPPVTQPDVWYSYTPSAEFPELETGGIGPMAGPAYQFDAKVAKGKNSDRLAGVLRQRPALLRVDARLHQGVLHRGRRRDADRGRARLVRPRRTRSTSSSGRTGRCTCSTTATASSARTCRAPSSCASTSSAPTRQPHADA